MVQIRIGDRIGIRVDQSGVVDKAELRVTVHWRDRAMVLVPVRVQVQVPARVRSTCHCPCPYPYAFP